MTAYTFGTQIIITGQYSFNPIAAGSLAVVGIMPHASFTGTVTLGYASPDGAFVPFIDASGASLTVTDYNPRSWEVRVPYGGTLAVDTTVSALGFVVVATPCLY